MNTEYDESIVEYLPKIGDAKNIKTNKQGRNVSLTNGYIDESPLNRGRRKAVDFMMSCRTIVNQQKASEKQKKMGL